MCVHVSVNASITLCLGVCTCVSHVFICDCERMHTVLVCVCVCVDACVCTWVCKCVCVLVCACFVIGYITNTAQFPLISFTAAVDYVSTISIKKSLTSITTGFPGFSIFSTVVSPYSISGNIKSVQEICTNSRKSIPQTL